MIHRDAAFGQELFPIAVGQAVAQDQRTARMITSGGNRNPAKLDLGAGGGETAGHQPSLPEPALGRRNRAPEAHRVRHCWVVAGIIVQLPFLSRPVCLPVLARLWRPRHTGKMAHARELAELLAALWVPLIESPLLTWDLAVALWA